MASHPTSDTICAIATPIGTSAIGVVKVSGAQAIPIVDSLFRVVRYGPGADMHDAAAGLHAMQGYTTAYGWIYDPDTSESIDDAMLTLYRAPHSYTGDDTIELSLHGSPLILRTTIELLLRQGCRMAEAGEYTRRALAAGKMDLSQAEAVADLVASTSRAALRMSLTQMRGHFSARIHDLREQLVRFASLLELELDFSEEEVSFVSRTELAATCHAIASQVYDLYQSYRTSQVIREGIPIAIVGTTNAGKSTLLNTLLHDDRAIVSDIHGTTRDTIEDTILIDGIQFRIIDTAGLRDTDDTIENIGIQRALQRVSSAELTLWLIDPTTSYSTLEPILALIAEHADPDMLMPVVNKSDLVTPDVIHQIADELYRLQLPAPCVITAHDDRSVDQLRRLLVDRFESLNISEGQVLVTNLRQAQALQSAHNELQNVINGLGSDQYTDLIAQDLRAAIAHMAAVTGEITSDDLLQSIFANFCIGK